MYAWISFQALGIRETENERNSWISCRCHTHINVIYVKLAKNRIITKLFLGKSHFFLPEIIGVCVCAKESQTEQKHSGSYMERHTVMHYTTSSVRSKRKAAGSRLYIVHIYEWNGLAKKKFDLLNRIWMGKAKKNYRVYIVEIPEWNHYYSTHNMMIIAHVCTRYVCVCVIRIK